MTNFLAITGSRLYGTDTPTSDLDRRGFLVPKISEIISLQNPMEQIEDKENDIVIYSLKKFFQLLLQGNTQVIETLFSNQVLEQDDLADAVLASRNLFLGQQFYRSCRGYALAEFRKTKAVRLYIQGEDETETELIHKFMSRFNLQRFQRNEILTILEEFTGRKFQFESPQVQQLGERRKNSVEEYGYSVKNASHCIRILLEGIRLLKDGELIFPLPEEELKIVRDIKFGRSTLKEIEELFEQLSNDIDNAVKVTPLPKKPDFDRINELYQNVVLQEL